MSAPYFTQFEYDLAELYKGKRQPFSGSSKHHKLDVDARLLMIEAKTAPKEDPSKFSISEEEFFKYHAMAHHKGKKFVLAIWFGHGQDSLSIQTLKDARLLGVDLEDLEFWTISEMVKHARVHFNYRMAELTRGFHFFYGWTAGLVGMPTKQHVQLLDEAGSL